MSTCKVRHLAICVYIKEENTYGPKSFRAVMKGVQCI
jgi:hypothetical protein